MFRRLPNRVRLIAAHFRLVLIRYRLVYWTLALSCALAVGISVYRHDRSTQAARASWGERAPVLVASHTVAAGAPVGPDDVRLVDAPRALVPASSLTTLPADAVARVTLVERTIVVPELLADPGDALGPDHRGVAIPLLATTPPLHPGLVVDLVGTATTLARDASVLSIDEKQVVVAVSARDVARVTAAARADDLTIVLT